MYYLKEIIKFVLLGTLILALFIGLRELLQPNWVAGLFIVLCMVYIGLRTTISPEVD
jgi:hypothetical protein